MAPERLRRVVCCGIGVAFDAYLGSNKAAIDTIAQTRDADLASRPAQAVPAATALDRATGTLDAVNPATRDLVAQIFATAPDRVPALIARARDAAGCWCVQPPRLRAEALGRLRRMVAEQAHEIAETIASGMGRPLIEALSFEVMPVLAALDACIAEGTDRVPAQFEQYGAALRSSTGAAVVCVIAPVSAPFHLALTPAVVALAAGKSVIVKTSSSVPLVSVLLERLLDAAFAPFPGLAQVVYGTGTLGSLLACSEGIDAVFFAGSGSGGRQLQAELAALSRPACFQLGGADPLIVCDDANVERAANAAVFGRFSNSGQNCSAVKRVYVQRAIADAFIHKVMHKVRALKSGPCTNPFCEVGPLANGRALQHLRGVLQDALDRRAELVAGGFPPHVTGPRHGPQRGAERIGWYWPPTVIRTVDHSMRVMKEPLFGPILPIQAFDDDAEAISLANDTAFGFDAYIFSASLARAQRIAAALRARSATVNDVALHDAASPAQTGAALNDGMSSREPRWFPYSAARLRAVEQAMGLVPLLE